MMLLLGWVRASSSIEYNFLCIILKYLIKILSVQEGCRTLCSQ